MKFYIKHFNQISKTDILTAGGKGASLGEMINTRIPVPSGFVVLSSAFEKFLEETDLNVEIDSILHSVNIKKMHTVESASKKIKDLILKASMPQEIKGEIQKEFKKLKTKFVAVRSSATVEDSASAAWAGQLDSFLNTTEETLLENVQKCWASLFTPRAIFYRFEKDLHKQKISVAVVVQKMVESEKSGIAFSVHPVTQDRNQLIIEAGFGLGEAIVSGQITPDSYVVEKQPRRIVDKNVQTQLKGLYRAKYGGNEWQNISQEKGERQKLTDEQILELSEMIIKIENYYNIPQDIEWAMKDNKFYIMQSRPITTLVDKYAPTDNRKMTEEKWFIPRKRYIPCVWPIHTYWAWPVHKYFGVPTTGKVLSVWEDGDYTVVFDRQKTSIELGSAIADRILNESKNLNRFRLMGIQAGEKTATFCRDFASKSKNASIFDFVTFFDKFTDEYTSIMRDNMHYWIMGAPSIEKMIRSELTTHDQNAVDDIFHVMSSPIEMSYSNKVDFELKKITDIARNLGIESVSKEIKDFSDKYFWFPYEYVGPGIWDQKTITDLVKRNISGKSEEHSASGDIKSQKECVKNYSLLTKVQNLFKILQALILMSDDRKRYNSEICYYLNGIIISDLANKLGLSRNDALYIDQEFLKTFEKDEELFRRRLVDRTKMLVEITEDGIFSWYEGIEQCSGILKSLGIYLEVDKNLKEIKGQIAYKGRVIGRVRVLKTSHVSDFNDGDIIVTGMTTPDFVPLIKKASAIITNEGGITCHAAIVAREMKKPCIIGTTIATQVLNNGDLVEVDADKGVVRILEKAK